MNSSTSLLTQAARQAVIEAIAGLSDELQAHIARGLDAHDTQVILDQPFYDSRLDKVSEKTLKIGVRLSDTGIMAYVLVPAIPIT